jgi:lysophospholipase L1-like esterase
MHRGSLIALLVLAWASIVLLRRLLRWPRLWEGTIRGFDREPVTPGAVVFMGSSSIRFWETLGRDMAPLPAQNRGFGGATVAGVNVYARRILARLPHPRAILLYAGVNDLAWGVPEERVLEDIQRFLAIAREVAPAVPVYLLSLQLTPSRRRGWARVRRVNDRLAQLAHGSGGSVRYVDLASAVLDASGRPRRELFVLDGIHMNPAGYKLWTAVLRPQLLHDLGTS